MTNKKLMDYLKYLPLAMAIFSLGFIFLPLLTTSGENYNIIELLSSNIFANQFKVLIISLLVLPFISAGLLMSKNGKYSGIALVILILNFTTLILLPSINYTITELETSLAIGVIIILVLSATSLIVALHSFFGTITFTIKEMVELAILIGLAVIFDFFPKIKLSGGAGSIGLTMLPLFIIAIRFNFVKSFISGGIIYGLLTCLLDGYGFATYPFDYLMGFGLLAVVSLFRHLIFNESLKKWQHFLLLAVAIIFGGLLRILASTVSSMLIYQYSFWAGIVYNVTYIVPSLAIVTIILMLLLPSLKQMNRRFPRHD